MEGEGGARTHYITWEREEGKGGESNQGMCFTLILNNGAASQAFIACENVYQLSTAWIDTKIKDL